ncbi:YHS domain-containing protein [Leisingera aquaemixtae]|uniref:YHS domain-containing (seleno)protein n=1 Tax=Leisingera aquaemixtae TaxID=1396826 RepID=UPI0021BDDA80|nr:YHS domain-containing (seleno)protein [Leisingera aquaemixtae]MBY6065169.1 YHS domain-containing protein [Leisingera aquaemixtae]
MRPKTAMATAVLAGFAAFSESAFAADEYNVSAGSTAAGAPLALHGTDPVAFLELGSQSAGSARYTAVHDGAAYFFTSSGNKDAFEANPKAYLPQNGGFCTFGVSKGKKLDGDPQYAEIVEGKLYVFLNEEVLRAYQEDRAGTIARAAENWPRIRHAAAAEL